MSKGQINDPAIVAAAVKKHRKKSPPAWQILGADESLRKSVNDFKDKHKCKTIAEAIELAVRIANG